MASKTFSLGTITTSSASKTIMCSYISGHKDTVISSSTGYIRKVISTNTIPANAKITSIDFSYSVTGSSSSHGYEFGVFITGENNTYANETNIKNWLEQNKNEDGSFKNIELTFQVKISTVGHTANVGTTKNVSGTGAANYRNVNLIVYYELQEIKINNFKVIDSFKNTNYELVSEYINTISSGNITATSKNNCIYKNYSSLNFVSNLISGDKAYYDLIIYRDDDNSLFYSSTGASSSSFFININSFNNETCNSSISGNKYRKYNFEYKAYVLENKKITIKGSFYLFEGYSPPTISNFNVYVNDSSILKGTATITNSYLPISWVGATPSYNSATCSCRIEKSTSTSFWYTISSNEDITINTSRIFTENENFFSSSNSNITIDSNYAHRAIITLKDCSRNHGQTKRINISPSSSYLNIELEGISIGSTIKTGDKDNPSFDIHWPTYFHDKVFFNKNLRVESLASFHDILWSRGAFLSTGGTSISGGLFLNEGETYGETFPTGVGEGQLFFKIID